MDEISYRAAVGRAIARRGVAGWLLGWAGVLSLTAGPAVAQENAESAATATDETTSLSGQPIAAVNVASVERVLDDVDYLFDSVDRDDMVEVVEGLLGNVGNLAGVERGKPFGVLVFLKPGLVPQPAVIGYLPVADASSLAKTVEVGPVITKKIADDRYEIIGEHRTLYARLAGGYAFVSDDDLMLDRELPVPSEEFAHLTTRFDVALEIRPENVPPGMRDLFLNLLRTNAQAELQRRDNESPAQHALRKSQGMQNLRLVEALLTETRRLTLGLDTSRENRKAVVELIVEAVEGSAYLETLQSLAEDESRFSPLLNDDAPLSISINSRLDEHAKQAQTEMLNAGQLEVATILTRLDQGDSATAATGEGTNDKPAAIEPHAADTALAARIFDPLKSTVQAGNLDGFAQFLGDPEEKFVAIAAVEVDGAGGMESAVRELLDRVRAARPEFARSFDVQYGVAEVGGVPVHRIAVSEIGDDEKRFWGDEPALYVAFDANAVWAAIGGRRAVEVLDSSMTRVKESGPGAPNRGGAPFQFILTANRWIGLGDKPERTELAREAFEEGDDDTLRVDFRPTEKGGRLRIEIEEGFIRMLGLGVSRRYDKSQL